MPEHVAKEANAPPHHAYETVRHVDLLRREVVGAVRSSGGREPVAPDAAEAPAPAEGRPVHGYEEDVADELLRALPSLQALHEEVQQAVLLRVRLVQHAQDQRPVRVRRAAQRRLQTIAMRLLLNLSVQVNYMLLLRPRANTLTNLHSMNARSN